MESHVSPRSKHHRVAGGGLAWMLVGALLVMAILLVAPHVQAAAPTVPGATYVGSAKCLECHADIAKKMEPTLHGKLLGTSLAKGELQARGCEGCHGPGSKHLEDPGNPTFNLRFGKKSNLPSDGQASVCLQCHARGKQMLWAGSPHDQRDVTCVSCHTIHGPASKKAQLKLVGMDLYDSRGQALPQVEWNLCGQCHAVRAMQFNRYSHMPMAALGEAGTMSCTSCHNPHGTVTQSLIAANSVNQSCTNCHAAKRGPFLYSHPPVLENCLNCHQAHGSNNPSLLRMKQPRLCETCHAGSTRHPGQTYAQMDRKVFNKSCLNCHSMIHGSNHPSGRDFAR